MILNLGSPAEIRMAQEENHIMERIENHKAL